jgi:hypothetical protein
MNMLNTAFETSAPILSDEEIDAQGFYDLEAAKKAERERVKASINLFQFPDNRTLFQQLRTWGYVHQHRPDGYNLPRR